MSIFPNVFNASVVAACSHVQSLNVPMVTCRHLGPMNSSRNKMHRWKPDGCLISDSTTAHLALRFQRAPNFPTKGAYLFQHFRALNVFKQGTQCCMFRLPQCPAYFGCKSCFLYRVVPLNFWILQGAHGVALAYVALALGAMA